MHSEESNHQFVNEIWRRVRIQEYERYQLEKAEANRRLLRRMEIQMSCLLFGSFSLISLILYLILGFGMTWLIICAPTFLLGVQVYEYLTFEMVKRRIYLEN